MQSRREHLQQCISVYILYATDKVGSSRIIPRFNPFPQYYIIWITFCSPTSSKNRLLIFINKIVLIIHKCASTQTFSSHRIGGGVGTLVSNMGYIAASCCGIERFYLLVKDVNDELRNASSSLQFVSGIQ